MHKLLFIFITLLLLPVSLIATPIKNINNDQLQKLIDKKITLIDIRRAEEWKQTGVVAGSKKITLFTANGGIDSNFLAKFNKVTSSSEPVILICRTGSRTGVAAQLITQQLKFSKVYNVANGITKWIKEKKGC